MLNKDSKIYIAGHKGMVGSACWRTLEDAGYTNIIGKSSKELDLRDQREVKNFLETEKPYAIIDAAAKVGGILANDTYPYEFLMDNMLIQNNLIRSAHELDIQKFIFLGSSCIYPKLAPQPLKEEYLLTGPLEPTNEWYAIAKISGVKLIESLRKQYHRDYIALMPTNLYGPGDNFDLQTSHVVPAMIRKYHDSKKNNTTVTLWGTGSPMREFLYVDDLAQAVKFSIEHSLKKSLYNVGTGNDISIKGLAKIIEENIGFQGVTNWDTSKPDGTPRKLLDTTLLHGEGWEASTTLTVGIQKTIKWFIKNKESIRTLNF